MMAGGRPACLGGGRLFGGGSGPSRPEGLVMTKRFRQMTLPALGWSVEVRGRGRSKATWFVRAEPLREESIGVMTAESSSITSIT
jgi:hypothetical protein